MNASTTKGTVVKSIAEEKAEIVQISKSADTLELRVVALEKFVEWAKVKLHFADQEVTAPQKRNNNPDYLPHSVNGVVSYHDRPRQNE